jgi:hypothetical protein
VGNEIYIMISSDPFRVAFPTRTRALDGGESFMYVRLDIMCVCLHLIREKRVCICC